MALRTAFTELFAIQHPIALAPMGGTAGGELAAAVSNGGGLGLLGGGPGDRAWLDRELPIVAERHQPAVGRRVPELGRRPGHGRACAGATGRAAVMLSFGDPAPFAEPVRAGRRAC